MGKYQPKIRTKTGRKIKPITWKRDEKTRCKLTVDEKLDSCGYAKRTINNTHYSLHRLIYQEIVGEIPKNLHVLHSCHRPNCINPNHLRVGTHQDNMNDMKKAERQKKGEEHYLSKLTEEQVREAYLCEEKPLSYFAKKWNVTTVAISRIRNKKSWAWLTDKIDRGCL